MAVCPLTWVSKRLELSLLVIVGLSVFNSVPRARLYGSTWEVPGEARSRAGAPEAKREPSPEGLGTNTPILERRRRGTPCISMCRAYGAPRIAHDQPSPSGLGSRLAPGPPALSFLPCHLNASIH